MLQADATPEGVEIDRGSQQFVHMPHAPEALTRTSGLKWGDSCRGRTDRESPS